MHLSVQSRFRAFTAPLEGVVSYMYQDVKGLVTIGIGNIIDPISYALPLPFRYKSSADPSKAGQLALRNEIESEWNLIKNNPELAKKGHKACAPLTKLELDDHTIDDLISGKSRQNVEFLKRRKAYEDFEDWPADAQLGLLSMAYAMGPGFNFPHFAAACADLDFDGAAAQCKMTEAGNPGIVPRDHANHRLFKNAAAVLAGEGDGFYQRPV